MGHAHEVTNTTGCVLPDQAVLAIIGLCYVVSALCIRSLWRRDTTTGTKVFWTLVILPRVDGHQDRRVDNTRREVFDDQEAIQQGVQARGPEVD